MIKKILAAPTSIILADSDNAGNNSMSDNGNNFRARQLAEVSRILKDPDALNLLDTVTQNPAGNPHLTVDIVNSSERPTGNSSANALVLLREVTTNPAHKHTDSDNVTITEPDRGNSKAYSLDRLKLLKRPRISEDLTAAF